MKQKVEYFIKNHPIIDSWLMIIGIEISTENAVLLSPITIEKDKVMQIVDKLNSDQISLEYFFDNFMDYGF